MTDVLQQPEPTQRLSSEDVAWLTTAGAHGQPQSSPVWFVWDGASLWLRSQPAAGKVRNIKANPQVALHLADDGHGGNIVTIEGRASLEDASPELMSSYFSKYDDAIRDELKTTSDQIVADYSTTIRITPTRARVW